MARMKPEYGDTVEQQHVGLHFFGESRESVLEIVVPFFRTMNCVVKLGQYSPLIPKSMARGNPGERENMVVSARSPMARAIASWRVR